MSDRHTIVVDAPNPACPLCGGVGVLGGCTNRGHASDDRHAHTMRFCPCVNERRVAADKVSEIGLIQEALEVEEGA